MTTGATRIHVITVTIILICTLVNYIIIHLNLKYLQVKAIRGFWLQGITLLASEPRQSVTLTLYLSLLVNVLKISGCQHGDYCYRKDNLENV